MRYFEAVICSALHKLPTDKLIQYLDMDDCEHIPYKPILIQRLKSKLKDNLKLTECIYYNHLDIFALSGVEVESLFQLSEPTRKEWTTKGYLVVTHQRVPLNYYYGETSTRRVLPSDITTQMNMYYDVLHIEKLLQNQEQIKKWKVADKIAQQVQLQTTKSIIESQMSTSLAPTKAQFLNILKVWTSHDADISAYNTLTFWTLWVSKLLDEYLIKLLTATATKKPIYKEKFNKLLKYKMASLEILTNTSYATVYLYQPNEKPKINTLIYCMEHYKQWETAYKLHSTSKEDFFYDHVHEILNCPLCTHDILENPNALYQVIVEIPDRTLPYKVIFNIPCKYTSGYSFHMKSNLIDTLQFKSEGLYNELGIRMDTNAIVFTENMIVKRYNQTIAKSFPEHYTQTLCLDKVIIG